MAATTLSPLAVQVLTAVSAASSASAICGPLADGGYPPCCAKAAFDVAARARAPNMAFDLIMGEPGLLSGWSRGRYRLPAKSASSWSNSARLALEFAENSPA
jgi:hypothetical protein